MEINHFFLLTIEIQINFPTCDLVLTGVSPRKIVVGEEVFMVGESFLKLLLEKKSNWMKRIVMRGLDNGSIDLDYG